jgi:hypothetical protein
MSRLSQLGAVSEAPLRPHLEHRAQRCCTSLEASPPHRMMRGASAFGARCRHFTFSQLTHTPLQLVLADSHSCASRSDVGPHELRSEPRNAGSREGA